ncbi:ABC transporter ATP-binding protein [Herbinix luporum]|jgi:ATP-binding cassette subfamily B protein|uniref:ABC transporter ATP-binding protein n=1 Tax=Herbinix luporum TaxID=1679721 RepID=UPI0017532A1B|nr:ABC transporter ATP-binding protein [Herbinix luporum]HHT56356.1 ABC transporter ATP-binding protein [Herbinix luporum]
MLTILRNLKKSALAILFVIILLLIQAFCDLSLPSYTSNIVNIGILQAGIESSVPEVIRASQLEKSLLFLNQNDKDKLLSHYSLINKENLNQDEWATYLKKYPLLDDEDLYIWDGEDEALISSLIADPLLIISTLELNPSKANMFHDINTKDGDIYTILNNIPEEAREEMLKPIKEQIKLMPDTLKSQATVAYVRAEYEAIGINIGKLQTRYILTVGAKMLGLAFAAMAASILVTFVAARIAAKLGRDLRNDVFCKVLSFSNAQMDRFSTASLITRSTNDIQQIQMMVVMMVRIVIYSPILALGGIIRILNTNTTMTWTLGVGVGAVLSLVIILMVVALPKFKLMQKLVDKVNLVMREILCGLPVIRAFSNENHEKERFDKVNTALTKNSLFVGRVMTFMMPALMLIMNLVAILIVWVGADRINTGTMQVGDIMAFIQYTMQIIMSFLMMTMISIILPRAAISVGRINEVLKEEPTIHDPAEEETIDPNKNGLLEFRNVSFSYPNAEEDVLSDISFIAKPGEVTAIIGSTGSGKSTLVNLIPRFYDVTEGEILINGTDIRNISQYNLRKRLGYVPQKGVLFSGTIESNISFGMPEASTETIKKAARIAQAAEFIEEKPEGYKEPIAQGGSNVSGGQKQRLSIARAIAKNPEIYIFDDSFSALDYKTDSELRKALKKELSHSTVIIVAQRISTIVNADQILVLDNGKIVGKGTHKELLKDCEVYRQIASSQLSKEELAYE